METDEIVLSVAEVSTVAQQLHIQFSHYQDTWEDLSKEGKRPYIRAASLLLTARHKSNLEFS